ncbi:MAG: helix-turn-helix transcriptional regulator [Polaromonas sp.]|nr:helix-turn-helix transcriptional regulator [Polaromonas sp.]
MYLSDAQTTALAESFRLLVNAQDLDELRQQLGAPITRLLGADSIVSRDLDPLTSTYAIRVAHNIDPIHAKSYDQYYQFCDPVTPALKPRGCASFTQAMDMRMLHKTEFFNDFLQPHGMHWGMNLYAMSGGRCVGDLLVFRSQAHADFERNDVDLLRLIEPALTGAFVRLRSQVQAAAFAAPPAAMSSRGERLAVAGLTKREAEVALLVFRGAADKEIARALAVEVTTVRYYLKNAAHKLGVTGRSRLAFAVSEWLAVDESAQGVRLQ